MASGKHGLLAFCFAVSGIIFVCVPLCLGHPQCLDSRPPFYASGLTFCTDYMEFGCCTTNDDWNLQNRFNRIKNLIPANEGYMWNTCSSYVKTFLCQTCSPYAAHIFDSERDSFEQLVHPRTFPGLCNGYCSSFFQKCKAMVRYYMSEAGYTYSLEATRLNTAIATGENEFCSAVTLSDMDYCYPELLTNPILNGNISIEKVTQEGCLCLEPYDQHQFRNPIFLKHGSDGTDRLFIGEQIGLVHIMYRNGTMLPNPFLDIQPDIKTTSYQGDERGMLGMEFHPNFKTNGKFYIYYSTSLNDSERDLGDHKVRIEELRVDPSNPNQVDYHYSRVILEIIEPWWNHNGGELLFGDDGYLYLFIGDGGRAGDPLESGQDLFSLLGKVLRIDVDKVDPVRRKEYSIPPDNPFADGVKGLPEIYAFGVRNIWRCGKDRGDPKTKKGKGRIVCGDVGQGAVEEIDLIEKGANYGWNLKEGTADYCPECTRALPDIPLTNPIHEYNHTVGKSVTGGHFYRGCESPNLNGFYIYGDFMSGRLFRLTEPTGPGQKKWNNKELKMCGLDWCKPPLHNDYSTSIISFGEDEYGEVYMLSTSYASTSAYQGTVYKIVDPMRRGNPLECRPSTLPQTAEPTTYESEASQSSSVTSNSVSSNKPTSQDGTQKRPDSSSKDTVNGAGDIGGVPVDSGRMLNYMDYFKKHTLRNKRRKMQQQFKEEREQQKKNRVTFRGPPPQHHEPERSRTTLQDMYTGLASPQKLDRGTPPPLYDRSQLIFHGISIQRCTTKPKFWCSLNRLIKP